LQLALPEAQLGKLLGSLGQHQYLVERDATGMLRIEGDAVGIQALLQLLPDYLSGDRQGIILRDADSVVLGRYIYEPETGHLVHTSTAPIGGGASAFALQRLDKLSLEKESFDNGAPDNTATPDRAPAESLAEPQANGSGQPAERLPLLNAPAIVPEVQAPDAPDTQSPVADTPVTPTPPVTQTPVIETPAIEAPATPPATTSPLPMAPVISDMAGAVTFLENTVNAAAQKLDTSVTLTDGDTYHFSGGVLSVSGSGLAEDALSFDTSGTVGIAGSNVSVGGVLVGALTATGAAGASLTLQLNGNATTPRIETLLENLTYANSSDTPAASRTLTVTLTDGDGGVTTHSIDVTVTAEVDDQLLTGTSASDTLTGGTGNDTIVGLASADSLAGNGGADTIHAGTGDDNVSGGDGADTLVGDQGADTLDGGDGNDLIWGGMDDASIASFNLTSLSTAPNLKLWLDGNDLDGDGTAEGLSEGGLTGSAVGTWEDKSGNNNDASQGTAGNKPTITTVNGKNTLSFDGTNDFLSNATMSSFAEFNIFVVLKNTDTTFTDGNSNYAISKGSIGSPPWNDFHLAVTTASEYRLNQVSNGNISTNVTAASNPNMFELVSGHYNNTAQTIDLWRDGTLRDNDTVTGSLKNSNNNFYIGDWNGSSGAHFWKGNISEIVIYSTSLTTSDQEIINFYLASKWGANLTTDNDSLSGGSGSDTIYGGSGNDTIDGGADADTIVGGAGADSLVGGLAADLFRFTSTTDAGTGAAKDTIADFSQAQGDKIDLSTMNLGTVYLLGTTAFTNTGAAEIRWSVSGSDTTLQVDTDGNGSANMEILLQNFNATTAPMTTADFLGTVVNHATFTDITGAAGVGDTGNGHSSILNDFDNDGDIDIYLVNQNQANILYRNNGNSTFTDITASAGVGVSNNSYGATWGDYDNDGDYDIYIAISGSNNILYLNNGNNTFTDVATAVGVADAGQGRSAVWADYDGDNDVDLYVANQGANILYRNNGNNTFTDVTAIAGVGDTSSILSAAWVDYDGDADLDLYLANHNQPNILYRNDGNGTFTNSTATSGVSHTGNERGVSWGDYDNDGDLDLYIVNSSQANILYRNNGNGTFTDITANAGVADTGNGRGILWGDYDADGDLDLYVTNWGTANILYRNNGNNTFTNISTITGVGNTGNGRGTNFGDIDGDGDLDLYIANESGANVLYRNNANPIATSWLAVDVQGPAAGVTLHLYDGATRIATRTVDGGSGYLSQNAQPVHFYALDSSTSYNLRFTMPDGTAYDLALGSPDGAVHKVILGSGSADTRMGLAANDYLFGLGGNDTLNGGAGKDTITGGSGADVFTFTNLTHSTITNPDLITDFTNGSDHITLTGLGFTALTDFETLSHSGGVTTLADTQTSFAITFTGDVTAQLDNTDFIW
jgi:Ca2+-binding RTX toxin-like protein